MSSSAIADLSKALKQTEKIIGVFHSHVVSEAHPGASDIQKAHVSHLQLIYDVCGREAKLWRIKRTNGRKVAVEVSLLIAPRRS